MNKQLNLNINISEDKALYIINSYNAEYIYIGSIEEQMLLKTIDKLKAELINYKKVSHINFCGNDIPSEEFIKYTLNNILILESYHLLNF